MSSLRVSTRVCARRPPGRPTGDRRREAALVGAVGQGVLNEVNEVNHLLCARRAWLSFNTSESTERPSESTEWPYFSTYPAVLSDVPLESTEVNL